MTQNGVFANPPKDRRGNPIIKEKYLESLLKDSTEYKGIYICKKGFGFAPYTSFEQGLIRNNDDFVQGGLARLLEDSKENPAENLRKISSPVAYRRGIDVCGLNQVKKPTRRIF